MVSCTVSIQNLTEANISLVALCRTLWPANVIYCPNRADSCIHIGSIPLLLIEGIAFLPRIYLGGIVDSIFLCVDGTCWVESTHSVLYKVYRRGLQCTSEYQFHLRGNKVTPKKLSTCRSDEPYDAICILANGHDDLLVDDGSHGLRGQ